MKVLLVGSGGREHALAWKLSQSRNLSKLFIAPGNPGTAEFGTNLDISDTDIPALVKFARDNKIDLVVVGPEDPLANGLVDAVNDAGIKAFGPSKKAAALEADKAFAKEIMRANAVPAAEGRTFSDFKDAKAYIASRDMALVVKATGLAKGKGVFVCDDPSDAIIAAEKIMEQNIFGAAGKSIIVEEKLLGQEASILAFVDGRNIYVMESSQDHKTHRRRRHRPQHRRHGRLQPRPHCHRQNHVPDRTRSPRPHRRWHEPSGLRLPRYPLCRPHAHRRRPQSPRIQRPLRRSRNPAHLNAPPERPARCNARRL